MKASDLMIGDWVKLTQSDGQGFYAQVEAIFGEGIFTESGFFPATMISPIPLTAVIMNNSGIQNSYACKDEHLCGYHEFSFNKGDFDLWIIDGIREGSPSGENKEYVFTALRYVHELQHALRLSGIKKEVEL